MTTIVDLAHKKKMDTLSRAGGGRRRSPRGKGTFVGVSRGEVGTLMAELEEMRERTGGRQGRRPQGGR